MFNRFLSPTEKIIDSEVARLKQLIEIIAVLSASLNLLNLEFFRERIDNKLLKDFLFNQNGLKSELEFNELFNEHSAEELAFYDQLAVVCFYRKLKDLGDASELKKINKNQILQFIEEKTLTDQMAEYYFGKPASQITKKDIKNFKKNV